MENKEFNISKPVSAFIALIIAFLVVGYYVVNLLDIETKGTTAEEALLPQVFSSVDGNIVIRYPTGWSFQEVQGQYIFSDDSVEDPKPEIIFQIVDQSLDAVLATVNSEDIEGDIRTYFTEDGSQEGHQFTVASDSVSGVPRNINEFTLLPAPDSRTLVGILSTTESNVNSYRENYELMLNSAIVKPFEVIELLSRVEGTPLILDQIAYSELYDITVPHPSNWEAQDLTGGNNSLFIMNPVGDTFTQIGFVLLPPETPSTPEETLQSIFAPIPESSIVEGIMPVEFGEFQGVAFVSVDRIGDPTQGLPLNYQEIGVISWIDSQQIIYIVLGTEIDRFTDLRATIGGIISQIEKGNNLASTDDTSIEDADSDTNSNSPDSDISDSGESIDQPTDDAEETDSSDESTETDVESE